MIFHNLKNFDFKSIIQNWVKILFPLGLLLMPLTMPTIAKYAEKTPFELGFQENTNMWLTIACIFLPLWLILTSIIAFFYSETFKKFKKTSTFIQFTSFFLTVGLYIRKPLKVGIILLLLFVVLVVGLRAVGIGYAYVFNKGKCLNSNQIKNIGGCDFTGKCDVEFVDGTYGKSKEAVRGRWVCTERSYTELE